MKIKYVVLLLLLEFTALGGAWLYSSIRTEKLSYQLGYIRFLQSAVQVYARDSLLEKKANIYPETLDDLIKQNYLTQSDLYKLKQFPDLHYLPPEPSAKPWEIIFKSKFGDSFISCPLYGNLGVSHE